MEYNEKQLVILEYIGHLVYEREKDIKLLSDTDKTKEFIEEHYDRRIKLLNEILEQVK